MGIKGNSEWVNRISKTTHYTCNIYSIINYKWKQCKQKRNQEM